MNKVKWFVIWCIENERDYDNIFEVINYDWCEDVSLRVHQNDGKYDEKDYPSRRLSKEDMDILVDVLLKLGYRVLI